MSQISQMEEPIPIQTRNRSRSTTLVAAAATVSVGIEMSQMRSTTVVAAVVNVSGGTEMPQIEEAGMEMSQMHSTTVVTAVVNVSGGTEMPQIEEAGMEMSQVSEVRESLTLTRCTVVYEPMPVVANVAAISMGVAPVSQIMDAAPVPAQARETRSDLWVLLVMFVAIFVVAMMCMFDTPTPPVCAVPPVCAEDPVVSDWVMIKCFAGEWAKNSRDEWVRILIKEDF